LVGRFAGVISTVRKGVERGVGWVGWSGTLLGPEGSARQSWFLGPHIFTNRQVRPSGSSGRRGIFMRDRSYFENFTVDASIFVVTTSY